MAKRSTVRMLVMACAVVLLSCCRAETYPFTESFDHWAYNYNGDIMDLTSASTVTEESVTADLTNSLVTEAGLSIKGYPGAVPTMDTAVQLVIAGTRVQSATITLFGNFPPNMYMQVVSVEATQEADTPVFTMEAFFLPENVTVLMESVTATWSTTGSYVVQFTTTGASGVGLTKKSALRILNAAATNGAGILSCALASALAVTEDASLSVDYCTCTSCTGPQVTLTDSVIDTESMFRLSNCQIVTPVGAGPAFVAATGTTTVGVNSIYLIQNCVAGSAPMFDYGDFQLTDPVVVSFLQLEGETTGLAGKQIPGEFENSDVFASVSLNGVLLETVEDYEDNGFSIVNPVSLNGVLLDGDDAGQCAAALCFADGTTSYTGGTTSPCKCTCEDDFFPPACTPYMDQIVWYSGAGAPACTAANCVACQRGNPTLCTQCAEDYYLQTDFSCTKDLPCSQEYCLSCLSKDTCDSCQEGTILSDGDCLDCAEGCLSCNSMTDCTECNASYVLDSGICERCQVPNCYECTTHQQCDVCNPGYSPSDDTTYCISCNIDNCKYCTVSDICAECEADYELSYDTTACRQCDPTLCLQCGLYGKCKRCATGYLPTLETGACLQCTVPSCLSCEIPNKCSVCEDNLIISAQGDSCLPCIAENCDECRVPGNGRKCATCKSGYKETELGGCEKKPFFSWWVILLIVIGGLVVVGIVIFLLSLVITACCRRVDNPKTQSAPQTTQQQQRYQPYQQYPSQQQQPNYAQQNAYDHNPLMRDSIEPPSSSMENTAGMQQQQQQPPPPSTFDDVIEIRVEDPERPPLTEDVVDRFKKNQRPRNNWPRYEY